MALPRVAIVGRPNVGKSSIFNWLDGRRLAIVDDVAGVTRDRLTTLMEYRKTHFELIDTGGMGHIDADNLTNEVEQQIETAMDEADVLIFVVDNRAGIAPFDEEVALRLRKIDKPIILVANKCDHPSQDLNAEEFLRLGRGWLVRVSTLQNRNREELLDLILQRLPEVSTTDEDVAPADMKVAIVGRRNTGKSTFVNTLAQAQRMIVSEVPGTTRDSVDVHFQMDGQRFTAIDTPGLRRNKSIKTDIDWYGLHRAQRSIRRADVTLLFFDCTERLSKVDKQLAHYISDEYKPCILVVNKWDKLAGQMPTERWVSYLRENFPKMAYCPIAFITGETGKNVKTLLNHAQMLFKQANSRISTPQLNRLIRLALENHEPAMYQMKRPKIYYATQIGVAPPTMIAVCNYAQGFTGPYQRYLLTFLRDHLPFGEIPVKLYLQNRNRDDTRDDVKIDERNMLSADDDPTQSVDGEASADSSEYDDDQLEEIEMVDEDDNGR
ncbi:MAG: ribosome biogenesis GTPase Der [Pirellulaceae bacterium]|nr:ribosome biogenesis GTPase Der [Pirellulaceae bacterium]